MKKRNCSILAPAILAFFLLSMQANAILITLGGIDYDVTITVGSFDNNEALLLSQPWWGSEVDAQSAAELVGGALGYPSFGGQAGPFFAYGLPMANTAQVLYVLTDGTVETNVGAGSTIDFPYAVASPVKTPEGGSTLAMLGLGLAGIARLLRRAP